MAVDFNQAADSLKYAYYTLGNSRSGSSLVTMGSPLSVLARINISSYPGSLGAWVGGCVNMPPGFGGYNKEGLMIDANGFVRATAGGTGAAPPSGEIANSLTPIPLDTWSSIGVSIAQNNLTAFLNGVPGVTNTDTWAGGTLEETIIGAYPTTNTITFNRPFSHCIEDLAFYNIRLTDEDQLDYANGTPSGSIELANRVLHVPFVDAGTAASAVHNGSPITLYFKIYNSNPSDPASTVTTCPSSPFPPVSILPRASVRWF